MFPRRWLFVIGLPVACASADPASDDGSDGVVESSSSESASTSMGSVTASPQGGQPAVPTQGVQPQPADPQQTAAPQQAAEPSDVTEPSPGVGGMGNDDEAEPAPVPVDPAPTLPDVPFAPVVPAMTPTTPVTPTPTPTTPPVIAPNCPDPGIVSDPCDGAALFAANGIEGDGCSGTGACHGSGENQAPDLVSPGLAARLLGQRSGGGGCGDAYLDPDDIENSLVYRKASGDYGSCGGIMPPRPGRLGCRLDPVNLACIREYLSELAADAE